MLTHPFSLSSLVRIFQLGDYGAICQNYLPHDLSPSLTLATVQVSEAMNFSLIFALIKNKHIKED